MKLLDLLMNVQDNKIIFFKLFLKKFNSRVDNSLGNNYNYTVTMYVFVQ